MIRWGGGAGTSEVVFAARVFQNDAGVKCGHGWVFRPGAACVGLPVCCMRVEGSYRLTKPM
jgi:hypothetical protein